MSVIIFHEVLTIRMVVGCIIIFTSIIVAETKLSFLKKKCVEKSTKNMMESKVE
ncbi:hypothetical protein SDC9_123205 [bioreactor metagenome]|uniref:EamA domain-containing protein n=1 Tax=bioreactor metagenome TaxID=1076179 RepID=A0A645CH44_9ZZZZ